MPCRLVPCFAMPSHALPCSITLRSRSATCDTLCFASRRRLPAFKVAVLGASGNIGRPVVDALLSMKQCQQVTLISRRPLPDMEGLDTRVQVVTTDLDKGNYSEVRVIHSTCFDLL